jgi:hypothetical protein
MSWVPLVTVEEATSETKNIYDFLQNTWGDSCRTTIRPWAHIRSCSKTR